MHIDAEMFYFVSGVALMLFIDVKDDQAVLETSQVVRIQPGTQKSSSLKGKAILSPLQRATSLWKSSWSPQRWRHPGCYCRW